MNGTSHLASPFNDSGEISMSSAIVPIDLKPRAVGPDVHAVATNTMARYL